MNDFRLLSIRPLAGCDTKFAKGLSLGDLYTFYSEYSFILRRDRVTEIVYQPSTPEHPYSFKNKDLAINISAVVGKNGSGKSSLLELFYAAIYSFSIDNEILLPNTESLTQSLTSLERDNNRKKLGDFNERKNKIVQLMNEIKKIRQQVKVEFFFLVNSAVYCVRIDKNKTEKIIVYTSIEKKGTTVHYGDAKEHKSNFNNLFYTIAVNYSLYGLNSVHHGNWLTSLFHKNDGYKTPLVINPFRDNGNIDVNVEGYLAQSRLIANLANDALEVKEIVEHKTVDRITFKFDDKKISTYGAINLENIISKLVKDTGMVPSEIFGRVYKLFLKEEFDYKKKKKRIKHLDLIIKYTIKKLFKIADTYREYNKYSFIPSEGKPIPTLNFDSLISVLMEDRSHITLKLKQILNTVRFEILEENLKEKIKWSKNEVTLPIAVLSRRIQKIRKSNPKVEVIELIPNAFFFPVIFVNNSPPEEKPKISTFDSLSSGEQQLVHSLHSIYYHLQNVNSVFYSVRKRRSRHSYKFINIVMDEIELYLHPEFQRQFIYELLHGIGRLKIPNIKAINILCSTHSPFILSDLMHLNVLGMRNGAPYPLSQEKTFGANIHQLLRNDFFLDKGFIGKWAQAYIGDLIREVKGSEKGKLKQIEVDKILQKINLIGEPYIKSKLLEKIIDGEDENIFDQD